MLRILYKSKIQRASITKCNLDYSGSIGIDADIIEAANIIPNEKVQVLNFETGIRFETYVIEEPSGSGTICLYGPAARLGKEGEHLFIISYCLVDDKKAKTIKPKVVILNERNEIKRITDGKKR